LLLFDLAVATAAFTYFKLGFGKLRWKRPLRNSYAACPLLQLLEKRRACKQQPLHRFLTARSSAAALQSSPPFYRNLHFTCLLLALYFCCHFEYPGFKILLC
jgi:hypothetical protein